MSSAELGSRFIITRLLANYWRHSLCCPATASDNDLTCRSKTTRSPAQLAKQEQVNEPDPHTALLHVASHPARTAASVRSCPIGLGNGRPGRQSSSGFAPSSRGIASRSKQQPEPRGKARQCRRATHWSVQHEARAAYSSCSPERRESKQASSILPGVRGRCGVTMIAILKQLASLVAKCVVVKKKMIINHQKANQSGNKNACVATPPADKQYAHFYPLLSIDAAGAGRTKGMPPAPCSSSPPAGGESARRSMGDHRRTYGP